jgi:hypothetical protein
LNPLLLTTVGALGRGIDFSHKNAGEKVGRRAAELCALATEVSAHIERAIPSHTPTALAILIFQSARRRGVPQHHHGISCGGHEIVAFLDNLSVLAVIEAELFAPIVVLFENFESAVCIRSSMSIKPASASGGLETKNKCLSMKLGAAAILGQNHT